MYSAPIMFWALSLLLKPLKAGGDKEEVQQQPRNDKCYIEDNMKHRRGPFSARDDSFDVRQC